MSVVLFFFFFQAEDGIRDLTVTGVQTCALPISQLIVATLLRLCGHGEHDDAGYVDPKLKASALGRDCLKVAEQHLKHQNWASEKNLENWRSEAVLEIEEAVLVVQREAGPNPYKENWCPLAS